MRQLFLDLGEPLVDEGPPLAYECNEIEGVVALRRRDGVRHEDAALVAGAVEVDLGDAEKTVRINDRAGDGLLDVKRASAVRGSGVWVRFPEERPRVIPHAECSGEGWGCR